VLDSRADGDSRAVARAPQIVIDPSYMPISLCHALLETHKIAQERLEIIAGAQPLVAHVAPSPQFVVCAI
jgi:hypothetical protein